MLQKILNIYGVDYLVREDGKIFSTKKFDKDGNPKEIKQRLNLDGYYIVTVGDYKKRHTRTVHKIVADAFIPTEDKNLEIDHIDDNRLNNNLSNSLLHIHNFYLHFPNHFLHLLYLLIAPTLSLFDFFPLILFLLLYNRNPCIPHPVLFYSTILCKN